jgi:excisionase family DNA binding protein
VPQAAKYLRATLHDVDNDNLTRLARQGKIQAYKVGSRWRVNKEDIEQHWKVVT